MTGKSASFDSKVMFFPNPPLKNDRNLGNHTEKPSSKQATTPSPLPFPPLGASFVCTGDGGFAALEPGGLGCPPLESDNIKGWWDYTPENLQMEPPKKLLEDDFAFQRAVFFFRIKILTFLWGSTLDDVNDFPSYDDFSKKNILPNGGGLNGSFFIRCVLKKSVKNIHQLNTSKLGFFPTSKKISPNPKPPKTTTIPSITTRSPTLLLARLESRVVLMVQVGLVPMAALVALVAPVAPWELRMEPPLVELPLARPVDAWQASVDTLVVEALGKVVERMVVFWWSSPFCCTVVFWWIFFICSFLFWCFFYEALSLILVSFLSSKVFSSKMLGIKI